MTLTRAADQTQFLNKLFATAVDAALPDKHIAAFLPATPKGKTIVVGAGKASAAMASALEQHWTDSADSIDGLIIAPYGPTVECVKIKVVQARHPVPDASGEQASREILAKLSKLGEDDLAICLISGGGSALMSLAGDGITLEEKQEINSALLKSGAAIDEMNCVRKHLSAVKGGRLAAAAHPAKVVTLTISDVPGDDPSIIASGPTVPDATSKEEALAVLERYNISLPESAKQFLQSELADTPDKDDPRLASATTHIICKPQQSLDAAAELAKQHGITPVILGDAIEGEAREVGKVMAGIAKQVLQHNQPVKKPAVLISGGETTVTVKRKGGRGGRNAEFLLGFAEAMGGNERVAALSADTDGIDGTENNAGVVWSIDVAKRAQEKGLNIPTYLDNNDAWSFFDAADALVTTGPTHTNVNDFRAILIV